MESHNKGKGTTMEINPMDACLENSSLSKDGKVVRIKKELVANYGILVSNYVTLDNGEVKWKRLQVQIQH